MPWANVLYACDFRWWEHYKGVLEFNGLKICADLHPTLKDWKVESVIVQRSMDHLLVSDFGTIGWGGNGGFHAINLAVQFGVKKIILVGYDMRLDLGMHWHGPHAGGKLNDPNAANVRRWCRVIDEIANTLKALEVEVVNCSEVSTLQSYPKMSLERALEC